MKRFVTIILSLALLSASALAQTPGKEPAMSRRDSLQMHFLNRLNQKAAPGYRLYRTDNLWTFLELETATGRLWQVHFSVQSGSTSGRYCINSLDLTLLDGDPYHGRFELYKTENLYNFLLIDTQTGSVWQAQWSYNAANRGIVPIRDL